MRNRTPEVMLSADPFRFGIAAGRTGLTPAELAKKAGVGINTLYLARRGKPVMPVTLGKIAKALDIPLEDLVKHPDSGQQGRPGGADED